jgi:hypothetical protein
MGTHEETALWARVSGRANPPRADVLSHAEHKVPQPGRTHGPARDVDAIFSAMISPGASFVVAGMPARP